MFFLLFVSNVIVVVEWFVIVSSGMMFQSCLCVPRGPGAFRASVFCATYFLVLAIVVVLSPLVIIILSGVIFIGEMFFRLVAFFFKFCRVEWSDESSSSIPSRNWISSSGYELDSRFQIVSSFRIGCFSPLFLSK